MSILGVELESKSDDKTTIKKNTDGSQQEEPNAR